MRCVCFDVDLDDDDGNSSLSTKSSTLQKKKRVGRVVGQNWKLENEKISQPPTTIWLLILVHNNVIKG